MQKKRLSSKDRKKQIISTTFKLISDKGFKSVSTRMIAECAGINEALIYKYFGTKELLMQSIVEHINSNRQEFTNENPKTEKEFFEEIFKFESFFFKINNNNPTLVKIILYSILENYPIPEEFDMKSNKSFLGWLYNGIEIGKKLWGFNTGVNTVGAICMFMGGLIYFIIETSIIKTIEINKDENLFGNLLFRMLKSNENLLLS